MTVRTITALFTDLVASTERLGSLSLRRAEAERTTHFDALRRAVAAHGGTELKTLGDGILAVFGSASAALGCAGAMQRAISRPGQREHGHLAMRVGISSGDAMSDGAGDWHGPALVEASRLCGLAGGGQVLVTDVTARTARGGGHPLGEIGLRTLRGLREPVPVHELRWEADEAVIRVVLADDSALVRSGIAALLTAEGFEVVDQVADGDALVRSVDRLHPEVVISDIRMPPSPEAGGVIAAETILARHPGTAVLLLSTALEPRHAQRLLARARSGVGYLSKDRVADVKEFAGAVRAVARGSSVFDPSLARTVARYAPAV